MCIRDRVVVQNLKVWRTGDLGGNAEHKTNARTTDYVEVDYAQPTASAITGVDQDMPTSAPSTANLGIGGALNGKLNADDTSSDYLVHQLVLGADDVRSSTSTMNYQYDEIA